MSKLRDLIEQGPALCGAINAARWGKSLILQFDHELADPESVFAAKDGETVNDRLETLWGVLEARGIDQDKAEYWINLIRLAAISSGLSKGIEGLREEHETLVKILTVSEAAHPDIAAVMSVQEASSLGNWA